MTMGDRIAVMKDGLLQQLDTPENLHERPVNAFVAGFIGSPAMNFFQGRVVRENGGFVADAGFFKAPAPAKAGEAAGKEAVIGIRPEDIDDLAHAGGRDLVPVDAKVEVVEFLGNELQLELSAGGQSFIARMSTETQARPGDVLRVGFNVRKLHIFDKGTEVALR
jgi:multiple sugar transport system ATP-binding protein